MERENYVNYRSTDSTNVDDASMSANEHFEFLRFFVSVYGKEITIVVALIGDNTNTNRAFSRIFGKPSVGCLGHHFHLSVKEILQQENDFITKVKLIMHKPSYHIPADKLRRVAHLKAKKSKKIR